jgi:hypothetical protein
VQLHHKHFNHIVHLLDSEQVEVLVDEEQLHFVVLHRVFQGSDEQVADVRFDVGHS